MHISTFVLMKPPYVFQLLFGSDIRLKKINIHLVQKRHWWLKSQKRLCQPPPTKVSDLWAMNSNGFQTIIYIDANNLPALVLNNAIAELFAIRNHYNTVWLSGRWEKNYVSNRKTGWFAINCKSDPVFLRMHDNCLPWWK